MPRKQIKCSGCGKSTRQGPTGLCRVCYDNQRNAKSTIERQQESVVAESEHATLLAETIKVSGDKCELTRNTTERVKTLEDLIRVCEIDTTQWEIERYVCNKWEMAGFPRTIGHSKHWRRESTEPIITPIYQVKAWMVRKVALIAVRDEIASLVMDAKKQLPARKIVGRRRHIPTSTKMLEISIPDLHAGKLAWAKETGHQNYDTRIAVEMFGTALEALIERSGGHTFDHIVFPIGNDLLNADNLENSTTKGTVQDTDARFQRTFGIVRRMVSSAIERLRAVAPVYVLMVPGNHDKLSVWHLGDSLECLFHATKDVTIDNAPTMRKYHEFGKIMLMFTHGDKGKRQDYPLLMATEQAEMFGRTKHREAHTGHSHKTKTEEIHGVKVRISPALCAPDAWHAENAFVGNARAAEAFVWDSDEGLIATAHYTVQV